MEKTSPLRTAMVNRSLDVKKDPFRTCEDSEEILGTEVPYMSDRSWILPIFNHGL